eukprot:3889655-Rhodomonas_salina.1
MPAEKVEHEGLELLGVLVPELTVARALALPRLVLVLFLPVRARAKDLAAVVRGHDLVVGAMHDQHRHRRLRTATAASAPAQQADSTQSARSQHADSTRM